MAILIIEGGSETISNLTDELVIRNYLNTDFNWEKISAPNVVQQDVWFELIYRFKCLLEDFPFPGLMS